MALSDKELDDLRAYSDRMVALGQNQQTTLGPDGYQPLAPQAAAPVQDPQMADLQAYADQMQALKATPNTVGPQDANGGTAHLNFDFGIPASATGKGGNLDMGAGPTWNPGPGVAPTNDQLRSALAADNALPPRKTDDPKLVAALKAAGELPPAHPLDPTAKYGTHSGPMTGARITPGLADVNPPPGEEFTPEQKALMAPKPTGRDGAGAAGDQQAAPVMFGGGYGVVPGGFRDALRPEDRAQFNAGQAAQLDAANSTAPLDAKDKELAGVNERQRILDEAFQARSKERAAQMGQMQADQKIAQAAQERTDKEATAAQDEVRNSKIDPEHWMASRNPLQVFALVFGSVASAYGSALTHTPDNSQQIINAAIDRDINAQQANLATKKGVADSALKRALDATGNLDKAKTLVRMQQLQIADDTAHQTEITAGTAEAKARIGAQRDLIAADMNAAKARLQTSNALQDATTYQYHAPQVVGGGGGGMSQADKDAKGKVFSAFGQTYVAQNDKSWEGLTAKAEQVASATNLVGQIKNITSDPGWRTNPTKQAQLDSLRNQVIRAVKNPTGDSSDKDAERLMAMSGDPAAWLADGPSVMQRFADNQAAQLRTSIRTEGAEPAQKGYVRDAHGNLIPVARVTGQSPDAGTMPKLQKF